MRGVEKMRDKPLDEETKQLLMSGGYGVGLGLTCPNCGSRNTLFIGEWFCCGCGIEFNQSDTIPCYDTKEYEADERIPEELLEEV